MHAADNIITDIWHDRHENIREVYSIVIHQQKTKLRLLKKRIINATLMQTECESDLGLGFLQVQKPLELHNSDCKPIGNPICTFKSMIKDTPSGSWCTQQSYQTQTVWYNNNVVMTLTPPYLVQMTQLEPLPSIVTKYSTVNYH